MSLGRHGDSDDEQSVFVQNLRRVQLTDELEVNCKTSQDAEVLRDHLNKLNMVAALKDVEIAGLRGTVGLQAVKEAAEGAKAANEELAEVTDSVVEATTPVRGRPRKQQG